MAMRKDPTNVEHQVVELDGVRYAILRESVLNALCRRAGIAISTDESSAGARSPGPLDIDLDRESLALRLIERRRRADLTQAELARRAGVRVETLNRVERGKTMPDFSTIRKLVVAMNEAEAHLDAARGGAVCVAGGQ